MVVILFHYGTCQFVQQELAPEFEKQIFAAHDGCLKFNVCKFLAARRFCDLQSTFCCHGYLISSRSECCVDGATDLDSNSRI
jgi:hypothetical protein